MNIQHTPGSWRFLTSPSSGNQPYILYGSDDRAIARIEIAARSDEEEESILQLIAAAPDLLEACRAFYGAESAAFAASPLRLEAQPDHLIQKAWLLARAAIAKAKGQS